MIAHHAISNDGLSAVAEAYRAVVLGVGAFTIGLGCYIAWAYFRQVLWPDRPYRARAHVLSIITSYLLALTALEIEIAHRAIDRDPITWRLGVATIAFPLGVYALLTLVRARAKRPQDEGGGS